MTPPTIFALSSGRPPTAIAIVRISGAGAFAALQTLIRSGAPLVRTLVRRRLFDPADGSLLDDAMVVAFAGPASSTGDDVVELHLHGGNAVIAAVLQVLGAMPGLALAAPGAFTRRAFDNGKLDLSQVEGLADLIAADTEAQRKQAIRQASGFLRDRVEGWRATIIAVRADLEATLDFAEEDDVPLGLSPTGRERLAALTLDFETALRDFGRGKRIRDGLTVAVTGPVNAGKSSLINALAKRDVAIVTEHPGTTRDVLEAHLDLDGVAVTLLDTAGLRDTIDPIEIEGIRRGKARAAEADLIIAMGEVPAGRSHLRVVGKADLSVLGAGWQGDTLHLSSHSLHGIDQLLKWLNVWATATVRPTEPVLISRQRHRDAVTLALSSLVTALAVEDTVLSAEHLRAATVALDTVIGRIGVKDILDAIFSRFCVGK